MSVVCSHRFGDRSFAKAAPGNQRKECLNGRFGPGGGGGGVTLQDSEGDTRRLTQKKWNLSSQDRHHSLRGHEPPGIIRLKPQQQAACPVHVRTLFLACVSGA